jgi:hypothetical protein
MVGGGFEVHDEVVFGVLSWAMAATHANTDDSTALVWWLVGLTALMLVAIVVVCSRFARTQMGQSLDQMRRGAGTSTAGSSSSKVST